MNKLYLSFIICAFFSFSAIADDRSGKVRSLMEAQGLLSMFEQQLAMGKVQNEKMGQQVIEQILAQYNPNEEFQVRFKAAFLTFMKEVEAPWSADEIVSVWGEYYGTQFSDKELDRLVDFYTSDIGKKEVSASKIALVKFSEHFQALGEPIMKNAMQKYIEELKITAKECNCAKEKI
ncbi:MAG: DUF2059 domain-containing protein [Candidatus Reddybacter sp.]